jgi:hypothetical protein
MSTAWRPRFFMIELSRSTGSRLTLVAALNTTAPVGKLRKILAVNFPGWVPQIARIDEQTYVFEIDQARAFAEINFDSRQDAVVMNTLSEIVGDLFDPAWF